MGKLDHPNCLHIEEHEKEKGNCKTEAWGMPH